MTSDDDFTVLSTSDSSTYATRWTIINGLQRGLPEPEALAALDTLAMRYRPLILGFILNSGINANDGEDVCHDFFTSVPTCEHKNVV